MIEELQIRGTYARVDIDGEADSAGDLGVSVGMRGAPGEACINKQHAEQIIEHLTEVFDL